MYERFAGVCALGAAAAGLAYSFVFVVFDSGTAEGLFLLAGGLLALPVFVALDTEDPVVVVPAALAGLLANPAWYAGVGRTLLRPV